jgi:hypothetical protein
MPANPPVQRRARLLLKKLAVEGSLPVVKHYSGVAVQSASRSNTPLAS